ncbi:MAG TPA: S53 family peptidase [Pseudonocardiaceae bacterium]|jgi:kumamolisin|nr:S53 family peptidase [Pseudonocardiaceae bacterium]
MTDIQQVPLPGSARAALAGADVIGPADQDATVSFTVLLRRRGELPTELVEGPDMVSLDDFAGQFGAHPDELDRVRGVLETAGARVTDVHEASRRVRATAPVSVANSLFGAALNTVRSEHPVTGESITHFARSGDLQVPAELDGMVIAVLGLDNRPQVVPRIRPLAAAAAQNTSYAPTALAGIYGFPADADGTGQIAAILEFGGGFDQADLDTYFQGLGVTAPSVTAVPVDDVTNVPGGDPSGADSEVLLDIEVLGALAPKASQLVYFAPNTDQGFVDAISDAVHATPTPTVLSISWGQSEDNWTAQARTSMDNAFADAAALGVTVTVAAGDNGSADAVTDGQQHADYPASSPHVLACGGTSLRADANGTVRSEVVWNDGTSGGATGGGVSDTVALPSWQTDAGVPTRAGGSGTGRGVPDVAAVADPATGYQIRVDGNNTVVGGTSAVAPLWAALICRYAQVLNSRLGLLQTAIYDGISAGKPVPGLRDITSGNNGSYPAGPGWDACTGLGVPQAALLDVLREHLASGAAGASTGAGANFPPTD